MMAHAEGGESLRRLSRPLRQPGIPIVVGIAVAVHRYGGAAVRNALRGERPADAPQADAAKIA